MVAPTSWVTSVGVSVGRCASETVISPARAGASRMFSGESGTGERAEHGGRVGIFMLVGMESGMRGRRGYSAGSSSWLANTCER